MLPYVLGCCVECDNSRTKVIGSGRGGSQVGVYKVIFLGLTVAGPEEETRLLGGLQKKFSLTPERAERLLQKVPVVVKKGISKEEMEKYVKAFGEIGGGTRG